VFDFGFRSKIGPVPGVNVLLQGNVKLYQFIDERLNENSCKWRNIIII